MIETTNGTFGHRVQPTSRRTKTLAASKPKTKVRSKQLKADRVLYISATVAPWALAVILLAVSVPHLVLGFQTITRCGLLSAWLLSIAFDTAQVVAKLQLTLSKRFDVSPASKWVSGAIVATTTGMSMALNVLAFLAGVTDTTGRVLAWTAGILLPLLVLALSYVGSCFALAKASKEAKSKNKTK